MFICCECCVWSSRGLCNGLITRPEKSYRLRCVVAYDQGTSSRMRRPWPASGCSAIEKKGYNEGGEKLCANFKEKEIKSTS